MTHKRHKTLIHKGLKGIEFVVLFLLGHQRQPLDTTGNLQASTGNLPDTDTMIHSPVIVLCVKVGHGLA